MNTARFRLPLLATLALLFLPEVPVFAQELVAREALDEWFYSRIVWGLIIGVIAGLVIGLVDLCRLSFAYRGALNVNSRARKRLLIWAASGFVLGTILLFLDAWLLYPFGALTLGFWDAVTQVWSNYRMLIVLFTMLIVFILVAAIATRFKSGCRCRYAFIPGPQAK